MANCDSKYRICDLSQARVRPDGDISSVFDSFTQTSKLLDGRFSDIKKAIVRDPDSLKESWIRVKKALKDGIQEIKELGEGAIPQLNFEELDQLSDEKRAEIHKRGVVVIKGVVPKQEANSWDAELRNYILANPQTRGFPLERKVVYELYWSKPQIKARLHSHMLKTMKFLNGLWNASPDTRISFERNLSYADRVHIREPQDETFNLGPHADGGSLERWEDEEYSQCYKSIFEGKWEDFDPFDATHRVNTNMERYDSSGACNIFRSFQGWLALSQIAPGDGTILFAPLVKEITAYWILRPFFDSDDNINFDPTFPGAFPGMSQEFNDETHPELSLGDLMIPTPTVEAGDAVFWHCDLIHMVDPIHQGVKDSSVLFIPSSPLCEINLNYVFEQRETFLKGSTPPDFPGFPQGPGETTHIGRADIDDVLAAGGDEGMQEFGLSPVKVKVNTPGEQEMIQSANQMLFL